MSNRTEKAAQIIKINVNADYAKATIQIAKIYEKALTEILTSEVCCKGGAEMKIIAQNAVVKAVKISRIVKSKTQQN